MKRAEPDGVWPRPQHYSIYCHVCGKPAARLVYQEPVARYMHYGRKRIFWHGVVLEGVAEHAAQGGTRAANGAVPEGHD